jgi:hypothetical protein
VDSLTSKPLARTVTLEGCWRILTVQPPTVSSEPLPERGSTLCDNLTALSHAALALQIQAIKTLCSRYVF